MPLGSSAGQLPFWNSISGLWVPAVNNDVAGLLPAFLRLASSSDLQIRSSGEVAIGAVRFRFMSDSLGADIGRMKERVVVQTTDATVTTLISESATDNQTVNILALVSGDQNGGASSAGYIRAATVKRTGGGIATLVGGVAALHTGEDVAAWDCTIDVDGANSWRVRVTGAAATTIDWRQWTFFQMGT